MASEKEVKRINELAKKAKAEGLTEAEKKEQKELRAKYIADFRRNVKSHLDRIKIV